MSKNISDIRSFFKNTTTQIEKKPEALVAKEKVDAPEAKASKKRNIKEKVDDVKAGGTPKKSKKTKKEMTPEKLEEKKEKREDKANDIKKTIKSNLNVITKKAIIDDEEASIEDAPVKKDVIKKTNGTKQEKPNLKPIDPKEFFNATTAVNSDKKTASPDSKKKDSPKHSSTPKKLNTSIRKSSSRKNTPKRDSDEELSDQESTIKEKGKKSLKTPIAEDDEDLDQSSSKATDKKKKKTTTGKKPRKKNEPDVKDGVLSGKTIVLTGTLPLDRVALEDILKSFGAKCTKSVSKKTSYLVIGDKLEDGRPVEAGKKFVTADKLGTKKLNFGELDELLKDLLKDPNFDLANATLDNILPQQAEETKPKQEVNSNAGQKSYLKKKDHLPSTSDTTNKNNNIENNNIASTYKIQKTTENKILWTSKYSPESMDEIIGNQSAVKKLVQWLKDWDDVVINGNVKEKEETGGSSYYKGGGGGKSSDNVNARAALISGPPGIGKTSTVRLIAKLNGYTTFELNASDQRNKGIVNQRVGYLMNSLTLTNPEETNKKNLIIMDECDGMAGNEDRGGISALIDIVKKTKVPIICICNDHQSQKLKSLIKNCYDLKFAKPDKRQVTKRMIEICKMENFDVEANAVEFLCESVGNDIRQCLNFLELWSRKSKDMKYKDIKMGYNKYSKDNGLMISNFSAAQKLLSRNDVKGLKFYEKLALYFIDYDLIPLLIHENYLSCLPAKPALSDMENLCRTAEHISFGDVVDRSIRIKQEWNLLGNRGIHSCIAPSIYCANFLAFPAFPQLLGKISKIRKVHRQAKELKQCFPNSSLRTIKDEMVPLMLSKIVNILNDLGKEGIEKVIEVLRAYKFNLTLFKENLIELQPNEVLSKKYEKVTPSIKASLTKKYNESFKTAIKRVKKPKSKSREASVVYDEDGNVIEEKIDSEDDEEKEGEEEEKIVVKETKKKKTTKK